MNNAKKIKHSKSTKSFDYEEESGVELIPKEKLRVLFQLASKGLIFDIQQWLEETEVQYPKSIIFVNDILKLTREFKFEAICERLKLYLEEKS